MSDDKSSDLGKVTCSLRRTVVAGSYQTCVLTYAAGFTGIDDPYEPSRHAEIELNTLDNSAVKNAGRIVRYLVARGFLLPD